MVPDTLLWGKYSFSKLDIPDKASGIGPQNIIAHQVQQVQMFEISEFCKDWPSESWSSGPKKVESSEKRLYLSGGLALESLFLKTGKFNDGSCNVIFWYITPCSLVSPIVKWAMR